MYVFPKKFIGGNPLPTLAVHHNPLGSSKDQSIGINSEKRLRFILRYFDYHEAARIKSSVFYKRRG
jgi:hypothetical protein